jgi:hypothetical protein
MSRMKMVVVFVKTLWKKELRSHLNSLDNAITNNTNV